ncbi:nucleolar protein 4-like isoform X2 [Acanthaster planci]|uniref:Nucleolar protein 4-like isoform X2 n=1 Tax=Acanthaster planci TaxID=133434 RepID=A0A8B7Y9Z0_ACAPL|nr:nucleolar protein 4-like isoform X2 [Acanthaster planci]
MSSLERSSDMRSRYQNWALQNYGDSGKTKTVTRRKYERITGFLRGSPGPAGAESTKFRFWVRAKGFKLGTPGKRQRGGPKEVLFVPVKTTDSDGTIVDRGFKRVAVVEDFFDIIHDVHVGTDGRSGKHAGQKRTYRAIAETYAFLPREAVTRFLMNCTECQKRMHLSPNLAELHENGDAIEEANSNSSSNNNNSSSGGLVGDINMDYSLPITTTYLNQLRNMRLANYNNEDDASLSSADTEASEPSYVSETAHHAPTNEDTITRPESDRITPQPLDLKKEESSAKNINHTRPGSPTAEEGERKTSHETNTQVMTETHARTALGRAPPELNQEDKSQAEDGEEDEEDERGYSSEVKGYSSASSGGYEMQRYTTSSNGYGYSSLVGTSVHQPPEGARDTPEDLSVTKDDDDDDDGDDDSDKLNETTPGVDPERLKAFNMFVRLFIDENLDRMVPISKQPKEKIQAIIEACYRQFPEFHERARKRIRTYLKSCRRMKRHRDQNGLDSVRTQNSMRPTPPHLTSARAEQILAAACESESENAKRLRMELMQAGHTNEVRMETSPHQSQPTPPSRVTYEESPKHASPRPVDYRFANGVSSHDPYYGSIAPHQPQHMIQPSQHAQMSNGPTDLSVKKLPSKPQLSPTEIANIRQLITSYRESAAFLYRSAEELEQMLLQLN